MPGTSDREELERAAQAGEPLLVNGPIPAEWIVGLLTEPPAPVRRVALMGTGITGSLDLKDRTLVCPLQLENCELEQEVVLTDATAPWIRLRRCTVPSVRAERARTTGDLELHCWESAPDVLTLKLAGAQIGGSLRLSGKRVSSVDARDIHVDRNLLCGNEFEVANGVILTGARIGGDLSLVGATLRRSLDGVALQADRIAVQGTVFLRRGFVSDGPISLLGASLGDLDLSGAKLTEARPTALRGDGLRVRGSLIAAGATIAGTIRLVGADVGIQADFDGADLDGILGHSLHVGQSMHLRGGSTSSPIELAGAKIDGQLTLEGRKFPNAGTVLDLEGARVGTLVLSEADAAGGDFDFGAATFDRLLGVPGRGARRCHLHGCRYESLDEAEAVEERLEWLEADPDGYSPQPYEQLATVLRRSGHESQVRRVMMASRKRRGEQSGGAGKLWSAFLRSTVGYGYRLWLAGVWLVGLATVATVLFASLLDVEPAKSHPAEFHPLLYSLDVLLPVVGLGQESSWSATGAGQWAAAALTLSGWLLTTAFVAGLAIRRS